MADITDASEQTTHPTIWEVNERLQFDEPLDPDDDRWVDTAAARGEFTFDLLYRKLGVDSREWRLRGAPTKAYVLFCGHRGCGKSTELRRVHRKLNTPDIFFAVLIDATKELDPNNLQYQDILMALAKSLLAELEHHSITVDQVYLSSLTNWFDERILRHESTEEFAAEVKSGLEVSAGIPFLSKLFASLTAAFRVNSSYKEELRRVVRNHFSEFSDAFNLLIKAVERQCQLAGLGQRVLFLVDGTDRLRGEDADGLFVRDVHQLQLIDALFIYTTPIHLIHAGAGLKESFTGTFRLPMIKLYTREGRRNAVGYETMRRILYCRAPRELFDDPSTADYLVEHSGGHPRDLLRLLQYTFEHAAGDLFDRNAAERAVNALATDYRVFLDAQDYALLRKIDSNPATEHNSERVRYLLYNLALLEYNSYWWRSHPVVRTLDAYQEA